MFKRGWERRPEQVRKHAPDIILFDIAMLIKNGRLLDPSQDLDGNYDLLIKDGVVAEIAARGKIEPLLGVFQKLIASRANDHLGFSILQALKEAGALHAELVVI